MTSKPSIIFMGTPEFARTCLEALWKESYRILAVYTQQDKPKGRGQHITPCPTALFAHEKKLPLFQPSSVKTPETLDAIKKENPDLIVVAAYGKFLPQGLLDTPKVVTLNVHASLLPQYRGASPVARAILDGQTKTGVSLMKITQTMDAGPVYARRECPIDLTDTTGTLTVKLAYLGAQLLLDCLAPLADQKLIPIPQDENLATHAPLLKKEDGKIGWKNPALKILNHVRAMNPWPGATTLIDNHLLKIYHADPLPEVTHFEPGTLYLTSEKGMHVACLASSVVVTEVQLEGKKRMRAADFVRGYRLQAGLKFI